MVLIIDIKQAREKLENWRNHNNNLLWQEDIDSILTTLGIKETKEVFRMKKCKICDNTFHYCDNCGYDRDLHPMAYGYCSYACLDKDGGEKYNDDESETAEDSEVGE